LSLGVPDDDVHSTAFTGLTVTAIMERKASDSLSTLSTLQMLTAMLYTMKAGRTVLRGDTVTTLHQKLIRFGVKHSPGRIL